MRAQVLSARLRQLLNLLRDAHGTVTANELAVSMKVSVRTLYRDLDRLRVLGVPIAGKTGEGLHLDEPTSHEPIARDEVKATLVATSKGLGLLASEQWIEIHHDGDDNSRETTVIARNASILVQAVLRAAGEVTVLRPSSVRRAIRHTALAMVRAHNKPTKARKSSR